MTQSQVLCFLVSWFLYFLAHKSAYAYVPTLYKTYLEQNRNHARRVITKVCNHRQGAAIPESRRKLLLSRKGPHFQLERFSGSIEFGATANLVTTLSTESGSTPDTIADWLRDERGLALSIWDPKLTKEMGENVYRLQIMTLQFVTLQLAPWVDIEMKTLLDIDQQKQPVFTLQSVSFDPNIQILPGMRINSETLGIVIEVAGILRPAADGKSVVGSIAFQTTGKLPPPMRVLPEPALKAASDTINNIIVDFAIQSFQKGARSNFKDFVSRRTKV